MSINHTLFKYKCFEYYFISIIKSLTLLFKKTLFYINKIEFIKTAEISTGGGLRIIFCIAHYYIQYYNNVNSSNN